MELRLLESRGPEPSALTRAIPPSLRTETQEAERLPKARYKLLQLLKPHIATMTDSAPRFGFVTFAETWNGRMAMLGFVIGLATEVLTGQSILSQIGLG